MKVLVAGGTGLIGKFLLKELQQDPFFADVKALTRRPKEQAGKVQWIETDFDSQAELLRVTKDVETVFCCLGTTMKKAGSKEAFRKVDYEYVLQLAKAAKENGAKQFSVISAIGASSTSSIFYSKVKGEMEEALNVVNFQQLVIFQPSMLKGPRNESRLGEKIGIVLGKIVAPFMIGALKKYRPIHVEKVAKAMVSKAKSAKDGITVLDYEDIVGKVEDR